MALQNLITSSWFTAQVDANDIELYEINFKSSTRTQEALHMWCSHELDKLDKELSLTKLKGMSDRAEMALIVAAQRDVLLKLQSLLLED